MADKVVQGGSGYTLDPALDLDLGYGIRHTCPDYELYPQFTDMAYGFLTRGCPRSCPFCIVSKKEGTKSIKMSNLTEFWSGQRLIKLLDPNLLACEKHEDLLQQLIDSKAWIDFTQGLDIRLTTDDNIALIKRLKIQRLHFAWDNPKEDLTPYFRQFKQLSGIEDYRKLVVYVLVNYRSTLEQDLYRIYTLRELGYWPYVMVYDRPHAPKIALKLQRWVNMRAIFQTISKFEEYK
jgi:hypothetical protein